MADLSGYSNEDLFAAAGISPGGDVSSMSDSELFRIAGAEAPTETGGGGQAIEQPGFFGKLWNDFTRVPDEQAAQQINTGPQTQGMTPAEYGQTLGQIGAHGAAGAVTFPFQLPLQAATGIEALRTGKGMEGVRKAQQRVSEAFTPPVGMSPEAEGLLGAAGKVTSAPKEALGAAGEALGGDVGRFAGEVAGDALLVLSPLIPRTVRSIQRSTWYRELTIPERSLVVQDVAGMKQAGLSDGQILRQSMKKGSVGEYKQAVQERMPSEPMGPPPAPEPTPPPIEPSPQNLPSIRGGPGSVETLAQGEGQPGFTPSRITETPPEIPSARPITEYSDAELMKIASTSSLSSSTPAPEGLAVPPAVESSAPLSSDKVLKLPDEKAANDFITSRRLQKDDTVFSKAIDPQTGEVVVRNENWIRNEPKAPVDTRYQPPKAEAVPQAQAPGLPKEPWEITRDEFEKSVPERLQSGILAPDGKFIAGTDHGDALNRAGDLGYKIPDDQLGQVAGWKRGPYVVLDKDNVEGYGADMFHAIVVKKALSEGLPVPPEVLAEYPDLKPKATPKAQVATKVKKTKAKPETSSFTQWVKDQGGIWDNSLPGEIRQFGTKEAHTVGLVRKKTGRPLDELAMLAVEHGWLPEGSTSVDLIKTLGDDIQAVKDKRPDLRPIKYYDSIGQGKRTEAEFKAIEDQQGAGVDELMAQGWNPKATGEKTAAGELDKPGTKALIQGEEFTSKGYDKDGNIILEDGETIKADPFQMLDVEATKEGGQTKLPLVTKEEPLFQPNYVEPQKFGETFAPKVKGRKAIIEADPAPMQKGLFQEMETRKIIEKQNNLFGKDPNSILSNERGAVATNLLTAGGEKFITQDVLPTVRGVSRGVAQASKSIRAAFSPVSMGPVSRETGGILRGNLGEMARAGDQTEFALRGARKLFNGLPDAVNHDFMNAVETGARQANPTLNPIARDLRTILDERRTQVQALGAGKLQNYYENYFPHIWKDPEAAQQVFKEWFAKRPMEGSKAFLKKRSIPTIQDGLNWRVYDMNGSFFDSYPIEMDARQMAGNLKGTVGKPLELVSNNPVDLVLMKSREMDKYLMAHKTIDEMKSKGLAKYVKEGTKPPDGWVKIDDKIATVYAPPQLQGHFPTGQQAGITILGRYYAPADAARIVNNYLSPGLRGSALFRGYLDTSNILNQAQLGMSAFHLGFTTLDSVVSKVALGINQLSHFDILPAAKSFAMAPVNLAGGFENIMRGSKVLKEWYKPGSQGAEIGKIVDALQNAGGRVQMDRFYATTFSKKMVDAFKSGNPWGGIIRAPFSAVEQMAKPIMEFIVPRQKLGVFSDLAHYELGRLEKAGASSGEVRAAMQKIWDSVDNRMGQLVYDNLFWNKTVKDMGMASTRSLGWNLGTFRELGGAGIDLLREGAKLAKGSKPELTYRMAYAMSLPVVVGSLGAMIQYLYTGKGPGELKDYFFPKTGQLDANGNESRLSLPSYMKDIAHYIENTPQTIKNKLHPMLSMVSQMLDNADYYGTEIRNADDPIIKQVTDEMKFMGKNVMPFSVQGMMKNRERGKTGADTALPMIGVTPAPKYIQQSGLQNEIFRLNRIRNPRGEQTKFMWEQSQAKQGIAQAWKDGNETLFWERVQDAVEKGYIEDNKTKLEAYLRASTLPGDIKAFKALPEGDQLKLLKKMDPTELKKYAWYTRKTLRAQMDTLTPATKDFVDAFRRGDFQKPEYKAGYTAIQQPDEE